MEEINGQWIMSGVDWNSPDCLHSVEELNDFIEEVGFLPLFQNVIPGFSVEEHTDPACWWSEDVLTDPWNWRTVVAKDGKTAYGKFFGRKAGFISKKWFPYFANVRRDGYDFDALWDDEKASLRQKKLMDVFEESDELLSFELKEKAGFGKGGEKNFEGTVTDLQMHLYLCMKEFKKRRNKKGQEYGWDVAVYSKPEYLWTYQAVTKAYKESPEQSADRIRKQIRKFYPEATEAQMRKIIY